MQLCISIVNGKLRLIGDKMKYKVSFIKPDNRIDQIMDSNSVEDAIQDFHIQNSKGYFIKNSEGEREIFALINCTDLSTNQSVELVSRIFLSPGIMRKGVPSRFERYSYEDIAEKLGVDVPLDPESW